MKDHPYLPHIQGSGGEYRMPELGPHHKSVYAKARERKMREHATNLRCLAKKRAYLEANEFNEGASSCHAI